MAPASSPVNGDKKVEFTYDYMGRRVEKVVSTYDAGWTVSGRTRFVYHNWLPLLELDGLSDNSVLRKYAWGLDLSGSLEDAGGIGGLLGQRDPVNIKRFIYFHDANGNVGQMIDRSDGSLAARYEYDAYGNTLVSAGNFADANPFRFNSKYWDDETDLGYWGYRYYSPRLGRWLSRDPIGGAGGLLLYAMVGNDPVGEMDPLGLCEYETSIWVGDSMTRGHIDAIIDVTIRGKCHYCCCSAGVKFVQIVWEEVEYFFTLLDPSVPRKYGESDMDPHSWYPHVHDLGVIHEDGEMVGRHYQMRDSPGVNNYWLIAAVQQDFETCALCVEGRGHDTVGYCIIGCWEWGHKWKRGSPDSHTWYGHSTGLSNDMEQAIKFAIGSDYRSPLSESFDGMCSSGGQQ